MNIFRRILIALVFVFPLAAFVQTAHGATLSGDLPTTRANGEPMAVSEIANVKIYRADRPEPVATITQFSGGKFSHTVPSCTAATYTATATDTGNLESEHSPSVEQIPLAVNCAPKAPAGLAIGP